MRFSVQNLRRLDEMPPIELKPITILVGQNSSGKSTFLRALPLLRQSVATRTSSPILWYGDWVDFGDFEKSVSKNDLSREIIFRLSIDNLVSERRAFMDDDGFVQISPGLDGENVGLEVHIARDGKETRISSIVLEDVTNNAKIYISIDSNNEASSVRVDGFDVTKFLGEARLVISAGTIAPNLFARRKIPRPTGSSRYVPMPPISSIVSQELAKLFLQRLDKRTTRKSLDRLIVPLMNLRVINKDEFLRISKSIPNMAFSKLLNFMCGALGADLYTTVRALLLLSRTPSLISAASESLRSVAHGILYIGPARAKSDRYYRYQELSVSEIDPDGKNFPMFLNSLSDYQISKFSSWVKEYFGYGVQVARQSGHISIELVHNSSTVNIVDTGYGVSQILPVLGQIWWATNRLGGVRRRNRDGETLIAIEQPELHLHPEHQGFIADALAASFPNAPDAENQKLRFLIETHSETLINRLGALISEKRLEHQDVQIVIFEPDEADERRSSVRIVRFDEDGVLIDWPFGFFLPRFR